jgi:hypothetical protein
MSIAAAAELVFPSLTAEAEPEERELSTVNETLRKIAETIRGYSEIENVTLHEVEGAASGLVHWHWSHFYWEIEDEQVPFIEHVNEQLLSAMRKIMKVPEAAFSPLLQEGVVKGRHDEIITGMCALSRKFIVQQFQERSPSHKRSLHPHDIRRITQVMKDPTAVSWPLPYTIKTMDAEGKEESHTIHISALARVGAGYILNQTDSLALLPCEDADIDAEVEKAKRNRFTDPETYDRLVFQKRNPHFVKVAGEDKRPIKHMLLGRGHNLLPDIEQWNAQNPRRRISLMQVEPTQLKEEVPLPE